MNYDNKRLILSLKKAGSKKISIKKDNIFLRSGDKPKGLYIISKGLVKLSRNNECTPAITISISGKNDIIGMHEIINDEPYNFEAYTLTNTVLDFIIRENLIKHFGNISKLYPAAMKYLCSRISTLEEDILFQPGSKLISRINRLMLLLAEKEGINNKDAVRIDIGINAMADLLGISERSLLKNFSKLEEQDRIKYTEDGLYIKNFPKLKAICNEF